MAFKALNTFGDLAMECGNVSVKTVRRWWQRIATKHKLKVKRFSDRSIFIEQAEAERFWKLCDHLWDDGTLIRRERAPAGPPRRKRR
jgi:hypothetical protein